MSFIILVRRHEAGRESLVHPHSECYDVVDSNETHRILTE
jgi:hypothetical protein